MEIENINIANAEGGVPIEIVVREGKAPNNPNRRTALVVKGDIESPARFYQAKKDAPEYKDLWRVSHVHADTYGGNISFSINELIPEEQVEVLGSIKDAPLLSALRINDRVGYTSRDLSELFRKNRNLFSNVQEALKLTTYFAKFKASIDTMIESEDNNYGNRREVIDQKLNGDDIPQEFKLKTPTIVGEDPIEFLVNIFASAQNDSVLFHLDSVELLEHVREAKEEMTHEAVQPLKEAGFAILYT